MPDRWNPALSLLPEGGQWIPQDLEPNAIVQPLFGDPADDTPALSETIAALVDVENRYFSEHIGDTRTLITCLRKLYYDSLGWNTVLVPGTLDPPVPFEQKTEAPPDDHPSLTHPWCIPWPCPKNPGDIRLYSPRSLPAGTVAVAPDGTEEPVPAGAMQEVLLADGTTCDLGHVLAGLDARNHHAPVQGHAGWVLKDNLAAVTWLGDLASVFAELCFTALARRRAATVEEINTCIAFGNPGVDMAGNMDAYLVDAALITPSQDGPRPTGILTDFYASPPLDRVAAFADAVDLGPLDPATGRFLNETSWLETQRHEIRIAAALYVLNHMKGETLLKTRLAGTLRHHPSVDRPATVLLEALINALRAGAAAGAAGEDGHGSVSC